MLNFLITIFNNIKKFIQDLNSFNKTLLFSAIVVLIIVLIIVGVMLQYALFNANYPPVISDCPDYWDVSLNDENEVFCKNVIRKNSGICANNEYPVSQFYNTGSNDNEVICEKYKWAKRCNIHWDGITNNNKACQ